MFRNRKAIAIAKVQRHWRWLYRCDQQGVEQVIELVLLETQDRSDRAFSLTLVTELYRHGRDLGWRVDNSRWVLPSLNNYDFSSCRDSSGPDVTASERIRILNRALLTLPPQHLAVLRKRLGGDGMTMRQIAAVDHRNHRAVTATVRHVLSRLRGELERIGIRRVSDLL